MTDTHRCVALLCVQDMVTVGKVHEGNGRDLGMTLFGIAGLTLFDKFYEEGGIEGCMFWAVGGEAEGEVAGAGGAYKLFGCWAPPDVRVSSPTGKAIYTFVTIWSLLCSALFWVGLFNVVDDFVPPAILNSVWAYVIFVFLSFVLMLATGTLYESSGVHTQSKEPPLDWNSSLFAHAKQSLRSLVAISAQVFLWYRLCGRRQYPGRDHGVTEMYLRF
jgi:hypothetical protein